MNFGALRRLTPLDSGLLSATWPRSAGLDPVDPSREAVRLPIVPLSLRRFPLPDAIVIRERAQPSSSRGSWHTG
jgi:hypothetical protein